MKTESVNEFVMKTMDYSLFKTLKGNRPIEEGQVRRLMESFKQEYLLSPILINEKFEIIDGQQRLEAAKRLNLPVCYVQKCGYGLAEVQKLNRSTKNWGKLEFLNSYCDIGLTPYLQLKEFMKNFPDLGIAASESICTNNVSGANNRNEILLGEGRAIKIKNFENGDLIINDLPGAYERATKIMEYKEYYSGYNRALFVRVMVSLFKNPVFKHDLFIKKLKLQPTALEHCQSVEQYKLLIERIYNFRNQHKVNLRF